MFKSILARSDTAIFKGGLYYYKYLINDSEFSEEWVGATDQTLHFKTVRAGAIINCYAEHNPSMIAFNLMLYHKYMKETWSLWYNDIEIEIQHNIQHTPGYAYYADDVRNYLKRADNLKVFW